MTVTDIAKELKINRNSVAKYLDVLLISGHVEMVAFGPAKVFFPSRRIPLSAILDFTLDYIALLDKDLHFLQINNNLLQLLHVQEGDILGKNIEAFSYSFFQLPDLVNNAQQALTEKKPRSRCGFPLTKKNDTCGSKTYPPPLRTALLG